MSTYTGLVGIASSLPPVADEASPSHGLGERIDSNDGRAYRYVKNGAVALTAGNLVQGPAEVTGNQSVVVAAAAIGATEVTTTGTVTVTANQYAGGWLLGTAEGGTGNGILYKIKSHPAATAAVCIFTLEDPLQVAFSAATQIDLIQNPYNGVLALITTPTSALLGVAVNDITANQYGWIQVKGVAAVLNDAAGAITVGTDVCGSNAVAGSMEADTGTQPTFGRAVTGIAASEIGAVMLTIE